jgi:tetratricopeptide (TPR) repeat protein
MSKIKLVRVLELLKAEKANEAQQVFNEIVPGETVDYYLVKGKLEQKFQNWGKAINAFTKVVEIEPGNTEAQNHLILIRKILNFWNPEMFNP